MAEGELWFFFMWEAERMFFNACDRLKLLWKHWGNDSGVAIVKEDEGSTHVRPKVTYQIQHL